MQAPVSNRLIRGRPANGPWRCLDHIEHRSETCYQEYETQCQRRCIRKPERLLALLEIGSDDGPERFDLNFCELAAKISDRHLFHEGRQRVQTWAVRRDYGPLNVAYSGTAVIVLEDHRSLRSAMRQIVGSSRVRVRGVPLRSAWPLFIILWWRRLGALILTELLRNMLPYRKSLSFVDS